MSWKGAGAWGGASQQWGQQAWGSQPAWDNASAGKGKGGAAHQGSIKPVGAKGGKPFGAVASGAISAQQMGQAVAAKSNQGNAAAVAKLSKELELLEKTTKTLIESSKIAFANEKATPQSIKASIDSLDKQNAKVVEMTASITKQQTSATAASRQELSKMMMNVKSLQQQVMMQNAKMKPKLAIVTKQSEIKAKEIKDSAEFKGVLAKAKASTAAAENAVNAVAKQAAPLVAKPEALEGEALDKKVEAIEKAAVEASKKVETARSDLNEKIKSLQAYAPEARKAAQAALIDVQKKISESVKTVVVYKNFKKEMPKLIEGQKALTEITEKLAGHEAPLAKASKLADVKGMTKEKVQEIDDILDGVTKAVNGANVIIVQKMRTTTDAATQEKMSKQKIRGEELKKKCDAVITKIKSQRDIIKAEEAVQQGKEKLEKAEECWNACSDAEMPFLTGVEVLPEDISEPALKACTDSIKESTEAIAAVKMWVQNKLKECKAYEKELATSTAADLTPLLTRSQELQTKVNKFREETVERKSTALLVGVMAAVDTFEKKVEAAEGVAKALKGSSLEDASAESTTQAIEASKVAFNEANTSQTEAKKEIQAKTSAKQPDARVAQNNPALHKINAELQKGNEKLNQIRTLMNTAERHLRAKNALTTGEEKVAEAEATAEKAKALAPADGAAFASLDSVKAFDAECATAIAKIRAAASAVQPHFAGALPKVKASLQALIDRKTAAQTGVDKVKADTKERKEELLSDNVLSDAEAKTKVAEAAAKKMDDAEAPFLIGNNMDLAATQASLAKCTEAMKEVRQAMQDAQKSFVPSVGQFGPVAAKKVKEGLSGMTERVKEVGKKLATFEKETSDRTKEAKMTEASAKVDTFESDVKKVVAAAAPFEKEGADKMSEEEAAAPLKAFMEADKHAAKELVAVRSFLSARDREQKANKEHMETLKKLQERISTVAKEVAEKKKLTAVHEQNSLGTRLLAEAKEQVASLDAEVKKATEACAPLLEQGGEQFLVATSVKTLCKALQKNMKEKELTMDALFKEVAKGKKMSEKAFVQFIVAEATAHDELSALSEDRRVAMFKRVSADGKAATLEDFKGIFRQCYVCTVAVALTNQLAVEGSETLCKVQATSSVELFGEQHTDEAGLVRSECTFEGKNGWITIKQQHKAGQPTNNLQLSSPFKAFCKTMEAAISETRAVVNKVTGSLVAKMKQGGEAKEGRLKEARDEMAKLNVAKAGKDIDALKLKANKATQDYIAKERLELNAHIEARLLREAAEFIQGPQAKLDALEADAKAAEDAGAAFVALVGDALVAFATPASVQEQVESLSGTVVEKSNQARDAIKEQQKVVLEVKPATGGSTEAGKRLKAMVIKVDFLARKYSQILGGVKAKCKTLIATKLDPTAEAIRKHAQKKSLSIEAVFDSLKKDDKIPEAAFCKFLQSLEGLDLSSEQAKLMCRHLEVDGISKDAFMKFAVIYYKITKTIAFTDTMDISTCKTLRKGELGEVVEVLEGPVVDEANQITRVRAKSTKKDATEGWITVAGSKGTAFCERTVKPAATA